MLLVTCVFWTVNAHGSDEDSPSLQEEVIKPIQPPNENAAVIETNETLNELFDKLGRETKPGRASATVRQIWREWGQSGSESVDLLMTWATRAMHEKKFAAAQDLLDQVIVLAPDYAEGWNRRATLYFNMADYGRSISDIKQTLDLEPRHFGALSGLASILQRLDREEEALETWYRVLEIYPANKPAQDAVISLEEKLSGSRI